jgi:hypothetical protein
MLTWLLLRQPKIFFWLQSCQPKIVKKLQPGLAGEQKISQTKNDDLNNIKTINKT